MPNGWRCTAKTERRTTGLPALGDVLTKSHEKGGLDFGTIGSSAVLAGILLALVVAATVHKNRRDSQAALEAA
ncbi:hypothetical protein GCM10017655_39700 [Pseudomonas turukhanskensis]|uniref:Uncharacterized protein n=1 Tax=Pseudomonas turukhanskensis TaxID=1806536 RepID=A0A9W6K9T1_9PSED|nr:hypothetical protein GCM10017655_39700 [Pseudomonas turukhanskensis]